MKLGLGFLAFVGFISTYAPVSYSQEKRQMPDVNRVKYYFINVNSLTRKHMSADDIRKGHDGFVDISSNVDAPKLAYKLEAMRCDGNRKFVAFDVRMVIEFFKDDAKIKSYVINKDLVADENYKSICRLPKFLIKKLNWLPAESMGWPIHKPNS